jgi:nucleoside 2-deoxyribosyltransferase
MDGLPKLNEAEFSKAQVYYELQGFEVINPHVIAKAVDDLHSFEKQPKPTYTDYLVMDMAELNECDIMVLLPGFKKSFGSCMEIAFATKKGMPILHAYTDKKAEITAHIAITTVYDTLTNTNRIGEVVETFETIPQ